MTAARLRGEEYLVERGLLRRKSTGELIDARFGRLVFPTWYFYDILRALEHLRRAGSEPDERIAEAIALLESKRDPDGRFPREVAYRREVHFEMEIVGEPSRWNTLRALRVLRWWEAAVGAAFQRSAADRVG